MGTAFFRSIRDELAQSSKSVIPLLGNQVEVAPRVFKPLRVQLPNAFAPVPGVTHETCFFHQAQMFGDRLTRAVGARGEPRDGHRSAIAEARHEAQAGLVPEGGK
jgi:hypothetical protein